QVVGQPFRLRTRIPAGPAGWKAGCGQDCPPHNLRKPPAPPRRVPAMVKLEIANLSKRYWRDNRDVLALSDVSLSVNDGEFLAFVGPSGCGKTSLLNIVAGLLSYEDGTVAIDGK